MANFLLEGVWMWGVLLRVLNRDVVNLCNCFVVIVCIAYMCLFVKEVFFQEVP